MQWVLDRAKRDGVMYAVVLDSLGYVAGIITPIQLIQAHSGEVADESVAAFMDPNLHYISIHENLKSAYEYMQKNQCGLLLVRNENNELVSMMDKEAVTRAIGLFS